MTPLRVVTVVGNPRPESRTHALARALASELAALAPDGSTSEVDLARFGARVLEPSDEAVGDAVERVLSADLLVVASPTYKATYTGLLKAFLDRIATGALAGKPAVPLLLGGLPHHRLAVDVHLAPLLYELGARIPARGLFVLESELEGFPRHAADWAAANRGALIPASLPAPAG